MEPVTFIQGTCVPLRRSDVDTDQIIPSDWLKRVERTGFEAGLFSELREDPSFVLNNSAYDGASILVAGPNFGTGSSREHAVWSLQQYGFLAVVSCQFGDIFKNNSAKCGLVTIETDQDFVDGLMNAVEADPALEVSIDIKKLTVSYESEPQKGNSQKFNLSSSVQKRLLNGLDDISITLEHEDKIAAHEKSRPAFL